MHDREFFARCMREQIYWITQRIAQGPYPDADKEPVLLGHGITHVLNVGRVPSALAPRAGGLREVVRLDITDLVFIPVEIAFEALDFLAGSLGEPGSRVLVHCVAGQNRSPAVVFLYLVACGMTEEGATTTIGDRTLDAVPCHPRLVSGELVAAAKAYGDEHLDRRADHPHLRLE